MNRIRLFTTFAVSAGAIVASTLVATGADANADTSLQAAKAATAKYHSVSQAIRDGYVGEHEPCVESPDGAMGIHYVNPFFVGDGTVNPLQPDILLYLPDADGELKLIGVEWMVFDADQDLTTDSDRPSVFGRAFDGPMPGHSPGMPVHYDLHVWFWQNNPSGLFAPFNPSLSCPGS